MVVRGALGRRDVYLTRWTSALLHVALQELLAAVIVWAFPVDVYKRAPGRATSSLLRWGPPVARSAEDAIRAHHLLALWFVCFAGACAPPEVPDVEGDGSDPVEPSDSDESWADLGLQIEEIMAEASIPGLAVAVTRPGEVLWAGAYGLANIESEHPVTLDTPFMLASVSKTVTGVAVMGAVEAGSFALEDDINTLLPFVVDNPRVADERIELRHLVTHTSGIRDNWNNMPYAEGDSPFALGAYLEGYLVEGGDWYSAPDNFYDYPPGTEWSYGNIATALAGYTVEATTSTPFDDYCDTYIFDVLGMEDTGWHLSDFDVSTVAMPYESTGGALVAQGHYGYPDYPDGQLRSSIDDMAGFLAAVSHEGTPDGHGLLAPDTLVELFSPPVPGVSEDQYVFWYRTDMAGRSVIGHNGSDIGVATELGFSPETGLGIVLLMNTDWATVGDAAAEIQGLLFDRAESL